MKARVGKSLVLALVLALGPRSGDSQTTGDRTALTDVLRKAEAYCLRLENAALDFICLEDVTELYSRFTPTTDVYLYDYQYVRKDKEAREKRTLLAKNGGKAGQGDTGLKTVMISYQNALFGPVGLMSKYWQSYHDYTLVARETLEKKRVLVVDARPRPDNPIRHPYGRIWVREADGAVLRIAWDQESVGNFEDLEGWVRAFDAVPAITAITDYGVEKNGLRFPSTSSTEQACITADDRKTVFSRLTVVYKKYKFFTVETEVRY